MSDKMPKEIWAMTGSSYTHDGQVWYSGNKINSDDVKYIRADFHEINIETEGMTREDLEKITGGRTVPQIVIDDTPIGGYKDLITLDSEGKFPG